MSAALRDTLFGGDTSVTDVTVKKKRYDIFVRHHRAVHQSHGCHCVKSNVQRTNMARQASYTDLGTNSKQFGLKTITRQIENQPTNHARSTNVHCAAHAESVHTV